MSAYIVRDDRCNCLHLASAFLRLQTIKYFSAERFMSQEYDRALEKFQNAQIQNQQVRRTSKAITISMYRVLIQWMLVLYAVSACSKHGPELDYRSVHNWRALLVC